MAHDSMKYFSIIDVTVTDDFLERRTKAAGSITARWRKLPTALIALEKGNNVVSALVAAASGNCVSAAYRNEVGADIKRASPTFEEDDPARDLEIAVTGAIAALALLTGTATKGSHGAIFAETLSAAMDMAAAKGAPRLKALWDDLAQAARTSGEAPAERTRMRRTVDEGDTGSAIAALAENGRQDAEELNLLWWTIGDWSALAGKRISSMDTAEATIAAALELSVMLSWPAMAAHRHLAHRNVKGADESLLLSQLLPKDAAFKLRLAATLQPIGDLIDAHPTIFVVLDAIRSVFRENDATNVALSSSASGNETATAWFWCERLVRELSLAKAVGGSLGRLP